MVERGNEGWAIVERGKEGWAMVEEDWGKEEGGVKTMEIKEREGGWGRVATVAGSAHRPHNNCHRM